MPLEIATKIGQFLNSWTAILIVVGGVITGITGTVYSIKGNTDDIENILLVLQKNNTTVDKEFSIQSRRADKRNSRIIKQFDEYQEQLDKTLDRQIDVLQRISYLEGKLEK